jgi:hypothetical protein
LESPHKVKTEFGRRKGLSIKEFFTRKTLCPPTALAFFSVQPSFAFLFVTCERQREPRAVGLDSIFMKGTRLLHYTGFGIGERKREAEEEESRQLCEEIAPLAMACNKISFHASPTLHKSHLPLEEMTDSWGGREKLGMESFNRNTQKSFEHEGHPTTSSFSLRFMKRFPACARHPSHAFFHVSFLSVITVSRPLLCDYSLLDSRT